MTEHEQPDPGQNPGFAPAEPGGDEPPPEQPDPGVNPDAPPESLEEELHAMAGDDDRAEPDPEAEDG